MLVIDTRVEIHFPFESQVAYFFQVIIYVISNSFANQKLFIYLSLFLRQGYTKSFVFGSNRVTLNFVFW